MTGRSSGGGGMAWPSVPLVALLESLESGCRPKGGARTTAEGIPSIGGEHLDSDGSLRLENLRYVPESHFAQMAQGAVQQWDILLVKDGATTGKVALVRPDFPYPRAAVNEHVFILRVNQKVACPAYVFYFLFSSQGQTEILRDHRGATIGGISRNFASLVRVPLPPLSEQRRIVEILDQADRLRRLRAEADAKADRILPALFIKMFGDPATNPMGWPRVRLGQLLTRIDSGWSPVCEDRQASPNEWGVLKLGAVTSNRYVENEHKALPSHLEPRPEIEVQPGDLLFTRKNTRELVGACAYVQKTRARLLLSDLIFRLRLGTDREIHPVYLWAVLTCPSMRPAIERLASGSAGSMPNISKGRLLALQIEKPPYNLQVYFAEAATRIECLRSHTLHNRKKVARLFSTLIDLAFAGFLTASWREAHMKELLQEIEEQAKVLSTE